MTKLELAWAAGLIDGEGCICIVKHPAHQYKRSKTDRYVPLLKVTMCSKETIDVLYNIFKMGSRSERKQLPRASDSYTWLCNSQQVAPVLRKILPYLVTKQEEADVMLEYLALPASPRGGSKGTKATTNELLEDRERLYWKLRSLKSRFQFRSRGKKPGRKPKVQVQSSSKGNR